MRKAFRLLAGLALLATAFPAAAWGPRAQRAIAASALRMISREGRVPLVRLQDEVLQGVGATAEKTADLMPGAASDPVSAIESQMYLLQAVRGEGVTPYFAYRLGVLGKVVAQATAPLANAPAIYRERYYADADQNIDETFLEVSARKFVDPSLYVTRVMREAQARQDVILKDYQEGAGFNGVARAALPEDANRSVEAVADVWHTILLSSAVPANVAQTQIRNYVVNALAFYVDRGNRNEINASYARLMRMCEQTPDLRKQIGDLFFNAGYAERAMTEYRAVLAAQPQRKDVVERIASYYVRVGDRAIEDKHLEAARGAYALALEADKLHPNAQKKLMEAETLLAERDARREAARAALAEGRELQAQADQQALQADYAEAIALMGRAEEYFQRVPEEFPEENREAMAALNAIRVRIREVKGELVANAQTLSNTGSAYEARRLAREMEGVEEEALRALIANQFEAEVANLRADLVNRLRERP